MSIPAWLRAVLLAGLLYLAIGLGTADLARFSGAAWRLVAWAASLAVFLTHLAYERSRLRSAPVTAAWHTAVSVALGAFGLALAATLRATASGKYRGAFAVALVAWPAMTGVAAFVAGWVIVLAVKQLSRTTPDTR